MNETNLKEKIREVPDFPKPGISFKDITTLLKDREALNYCIKKMAEHYKDKNIDVIVGPESRGFIFAALAYELKKGFVLIRKPGKLPAETVKQTYELEYGTDSIEMHKDAIKQGQNVLICDDVVATGGTAKASADLVKKQGGKIEGMAFIVELAFLCAREKKLKDYDVYSLVKYEKE